ncbi:MAG TPA: beta-ketoacyl-[acyl-carrier-protein] synthase family protein [Lacipirellulaceae bacterium]|nr:beta-ketoacyl-[acyl-carrier-protein] synthase family protein [Lacipirellulaceae bacterium]
MAEREVVITGLGIVSPIGVGREAVWDSIVARRSGVRMQPDLASAGWIAPFGAPISDFDPKALIQPRKSIKVMSRGIQLASAAAELAWQDAKLGEATLDPERFGVVGAAGIMYCDLEELKGPFQEWIKQEDFDIHRWSRNAMGELYPLWMLKYLPNMPACHIGIRYDARGPNNTIAEGDVSSLLAVSEAADVIRRGHADVMIVGGTGSRINLSDMMWHRGARLALNGKPDPAQICRPFDAERSGMVCGEGAAQIVLENREFAERRGVKPLALIAGIASRTESAAVGQQPTGDAIRRAILAALAAAERKPSEIGHVNAHGLSTREDDPIEARAIRSTLGDVPVTALKSYFGNLGQGSGMVELAVSVMALEKGVVPASLNYETPDPDCPVNVATETVATKQRSFVKLSHNAMGQAAAVVIDAI